MTYRIEVEIAQDGKLVINNLPFEKGKKVAVTVAEAKPNDQEKYPLRGRLVKYDSPFTAAVDDTDWEVHS